MSRTRRQRTPFNASRKRLEVVFVDDQMNDPEKRSHIPRWFNDEPGRHDRAVSAGYEFVNSVEVLGVGDKEVHGGNSDIGSRVSRIVGKAEGGEPVRATLMKIKREWYDEDQAAKESQNALIDNALRSGDNPGVATVEKKYGDISISR